VIQQGRKLPKDVIECWPEVFGEVKLHVLPLRYLHAVVITFKDGKIWEVKITKEDHINGWSSFEESLIELYQNYEAKIDNVDFRLDTERLKKDIERGTQRFLKKRKL
jgi:hypothetical protein